MKKIYFAGSIRGGRKDKGLYEKLIIYLQDFGEVLTEHVGHKDLTDSGESSMSDKEIFERDIAWLTASDIIVAEVTTPSLGVGFEIARGLELKKTILCLYRIRKDKNLSAMISGCPGLMIEEYKTINEAKQIIARIIR